MKLAFVADVHIGNHTRFGGPLVCSQNDRCRLALATLRSTYSRAKAEGCGAFYVLGDLFDTHRPEPPVIAAVQEVWSGETGGDVRLVVGNHDQHSSVVGDNALAPLDTPRTRVVDSVEVAQHDGVTVVAIPYLPGDSRMWLPDMVANVTVPPRRADVRVLALHVGITTAATPSFLQEAHDAVPLSMLFDLAERYGYQYVLAGNWHQRAKWTKGDITVLQVGALCPTGFDNPGLDLYGTLAVLTVNGARRHQLDIVDLPGPRFVKTSSVEELQRLRGRPGDALFVEHTCPASSAQEAEHELVRLFTSNMVYRYELVVQPESRALKREDGGELDAERPPVVLEEVARYISKMPLPDGVDRVRVQELVSRYLSA